MQLQSLEVEGGAVAFVACEFVAGVEAVHFDHDAVAGDLGEDACGGDAVAGLVAADDGGVGEGEVGDGESVDEDVVWGLREGGGRKAHGLVGGAKDVDAVDFLRADSLDVPEDIGACGEFRVEGFALFFGELLGVAKDGVAEAGGQDDCGGDDGAGEGPAACLVDACDEAVADGAEFIFEFEAAPHGRGAWGSKRVDG